VPKPLNTWKQKVLLSYYRYRSYYLQLKFLTTPVAPILKRYRSYFLPSHYRYYRKLVQGSTSAASGAERIALLDFSTPLLDSDGGRYFALLFRSLREAGYRVLIQDHFTFLAGSLRKGLKKHLFEEQDYEIVSMTDSSMPAGCLRFCDRRLENHQAAKTVRLCRIRGRRPFRLGENELWWPYPSLQRPTGREAYRKKQRSARVLFAGNVVPQYHSKGIKDHRLLSRLEIMFSLLDSCLPLQEYAEDHLLADEREPRVHVPRFDREQNRTVRYVSHSQWLPLLSSADFFIAAPGTRMPFAHNVVEAMLCSTIPIVEYDRYFFPPLSDGVNSLCFRGKAGLIEAVERALAMDTETIEKLRAGILAYYEQHLDFAKFAKRLEHHAAREVIVWFYA